MYGQYYCNCNQNQQMDNKVKNMRINKSSKSLKPMDPQLKEDSQLRIKVRILQQQVALLQKSNLNIFIPISEHIQTDNTDYQAIITKLKQQILQMDQQIGNNKQKIKKLQREKIQMKDQFQRKLEEEKRRFESLAKAKEQIQVQLQELNSEYDKKKEECQHFKKEIIGRDVEIRFLKQDLQQADNKNKALNKQIVQIKSIISEVIYSSRIYTSREVKCICIEKTEYDDLKNTIARLEAKIRELIEANRRETIVLGTRKTNIGEEIVRLKKNIDMQLGIGGNSKHSEQFLKIYKSTNSLFDELIRKCQT